VRLNLPLDANSLYLEAGRRFAPLDLLLSAQVRPSYRLMTGHAHCAGCVVDKSAGFKVVLRRGRMLVIVFGVGVP
jgi:hypothetical protein